MRHKLAAIASGDLDRSSIETLVRLQEAAAERVTKAPTMSPLETSDLEDQLADWLDEHGVRGGWEIAPTLVQAGLDEEFLDDVADVVVDGRSRVRCGG